MFFPLFGGDAQTDAYKPRTIEIAKQSPVTARFNYRGQNLLRFGTYGGDNTPADDLRRMLATLRSDHGDFIYLIAITRWSDAAQRVPGERGRFHKHRCGASEAYSQLPGCCRRHRYDLWRGVAATDRTFDVEFYRRYVIPTLKSVLGEEPYRDKFLVLRRKIGYFQFMSGSTLDEDGTRTLRGSFEAAMDAKPDMIGLAEWDELNEHTTIEPTVQNGFSTQRIIKYYMRQIKGLEPAPNAGDDTRIPNLIVSYRRKLTLGEQVEIEMLNVPDGSADDYSVTASLVDEGGRTICDAKPVTFDAAELTEHRWTIPSESLAGVMVLRPELAITTADERALSVRDGLHHIIVRPTDNWDYKWVKQPLRDLIAPPECKFEMKPTDRPGGSHAVTARFACDERLASLEVLENDDEVYAVDVAGECPDRDAMMLLRIDMRAMRRHELKGTLRIAGADVEYLGKSDGRYFFNEGDHVRLDTNLAALAPRVLRRAAARAGVRGHARAGFHRAAGRNPFEEAGHGRHLLRAFQARRDRDDPGLRPGAASAAAH